MVMYAVSFVEGRPVKQKNRKHTEKNKNETVNLTIMLTGINTKLRLSVYMIY
jgi:hypothetical protein